MARWIFIRWINPFVAEFSYLGYRVLVPLSRLIPHPLCEVQARNEGITDPNAIARYCAEKSSVFGISLEHWFLHRLKEGKLDSFDDELIEKAYEFPPNIDFACVRNCILRGGLTDICIAHCSSW